MMMLLAMATILGDDACVDDSNSTPSCTASIRTALLTADILGNEIAAPQIASLSLSTMVPLTTAQTGLPAVRQFLLDLEVDCLLGCICIMASWHGGDDE
jgi:hypothetical protein